MRTMTFAGLALLWASTAAAQSAPIAVPTLTGPVPVTKESGEPFRGANEQPVAGPGLPPPVLIPYGYIEEEYFVSGTVDGKPYSTSMLVRKPKDPKKFSGLIAVETIHAQGAIPMWGQREIWMTGGHAWVAVASQRVALESHVKGTMSARYAALQIPPAPAAAGAQGGGPMGGGAQDTISRDIMTQVGALLKSNSKTGPFAGMRVRSLVMGGSSQTGGTTLRYIELSHARARLADGKPVYDAYMPMEAFSNTPVVTGDAIVMHVVAEGDLMNSLSSKRMPGLRPDGDAPTDRYRHYQVVGASHVGTRGVSDPLKIFSTLGDAFKPGEHLSQFPSAQVFRAATFNLVKWVMEGVAPPQVPHIEVANLDIVRDEFGNAKGGLRTPYVDMPTVRYIAARSGTNAAHRMIGLQEPIPAEKLRSMYKSRAEYLKRFNQQIDRMVTQRLLLPKDGETLKAEEAKNPPL